MPGIQKLSKNRIVAGGFTLLLVVLCSAQLFSQTKFPGKTWDMAQNPEELGYSSEKLQEAIDFTGTIKTAAVVIVVDGVILAEWGEVTKKFMTHSVRKSFLSAMYGKYVRNGSIDLDKTMAELGIDDTPPLSEQESGATVRDLIKSRSGIYHPA